ncbi:SAM-dependent methyltransferase [Pedobacter sp. PACM 27299]|uniref:class I SAM-dependent DNA methyltransferase n=1 Tax=Pedobacter sp. PACM 27299 TaxID=1727164 RepID=UPI00070683FB|nr:N-6 DNA methylase [Pedobacter sp. PACM 27299]ALL05627.1 SAM-dependent methyltransferase [Pedobacter sp. PACM 27299]
MSAEVIAQKLWGLCNVLRDDGVTYHQYLNELTFILFLRLSQIKQFEEDIPEEYRWDKLKGISDNKELFDTYRELLATISAKSPNAMVTEIYANASTTLRKPVNLRTLITSIDDIDWYEEREKDKIATIYEELLEKNAGEKKSGAGQYFTPRPLINIMVELMVPKLGERWNDPAAGTFGFMIAADEYLRNKHDHYYGLDAAKRDFQVREAFTGCELVPDAHRLALMNAKLHGIESKIVLGDTLSEQGKGFKNFDGVLANPPFGTKKGGERPSRDDLTFLSSNKQLNFLQHIYRSLKADGKARAAVVLPDNVLFEDGDGLKIRRDLMEKCDLHTILRLPTGIFYAAGVKTNVLFFTRGKKEVDNTKNVWVYDMRTNAPSYGKRTPFTRNAFDDFIKAYTGGIAETELKTSWLGEISEAKRSEVTGTDKRWQCFSREQIAAKNDSLDIGLIADDTLNDGADLGEPVDIARHALAELKSITDELNKIMKELG